MENDKSEHTEKQASIADLLQLVTFNLCNEEFAVDILNIQGINRMVQVTRVPNAPDFVEGIINLRGQVIPIIDLRKRLKMPPKEYDKQTRFIVVEIRTIVIGFIVDSVNEVLRVPRNITEPPPSLIGNINNEFITAIAKLEDRLITLLDLNMILSVDETLSVENVAK